MARHTERVGQDEEGSEHIVQLFDDPTSLAEGVSEFLYQGWTRGDQLLIVARPDRRRSILRALRRRACPTVAMIGRGQLVSLDATELLDRFMRAGWPDAQAFDQSVGSLVRQMSGTGRALRIYGEMVDILAEQDDFQGAQQVEALWNALSATAPLTLLCGYLSHHFGDEKQAAALHGICQAHTSAKAEAADLLGSWLLADRQQRFRPHA